MRESQTWDFHHRSLSELKQYLEKIQTLVGNRKGSAIQSLVFMGVDLLEAFTKDFEMYSLAGLHADLNNDDQFLDTLEELSINYSILSSLSPEKRITLLMAKSMIARICMNRFIKGCEKCQTPISCSDRHKK